MGQAAALSHAIWRLSQSFEKKWASLYDSPSRLLRPRILEPSQDSHVQPLRSELNEMKRLYLVLLLVLDMRRDCLHCGHLARFIFCIAYFFFCGRIYPCPSLILSPRIPPP